LAAISSIFPC